MRIKKELELSDYEHGGQMDQDQDHTIMAVPGIVAAFPSNTIDDYRSLVFRQRFSQVGSLKCFYSASNSTAVTKNAQKVSLIGSEENADDDGCEYVMAAVNKLTKHVNFHPVKFVTFERATTSELNFAAENSHSEKVDYTLNNNLKVETWADKRRDLTNEFGSAKKTKMMDAAKRRQIKDETLSIMMNSAFKSPNAEAEQQKDKETSPHISLLTSAESSVLPKANTAAKLPCDVYLFSLFLSEAEILALKNEAFEHLNYSKKELLEKGFSEILYSLRGNMSENADRLCFVLLLDAMVCCYKLFSKRRFLAQTEWVGLKYPSTLLDKLRELFFPGEFTRSSQRNKQLKMALNLVEKDRLLAHIICLAIMLDEESMSLPLTPWSKELSVTDAKIAKIAIALGCSVHSASAGEGIRLGTTRIARLNGPPITQYRRFSARNGGR